MAIAFGRAASNSSIDGSSPVVVTIVLNAGETGVLTFTTVGATLATLSSITGGGTWTRQATTTNGIVKQEIWTTGLNAAVAATSVSVAFSTGSDGVTICIGAYTGVGAFGLTATATGTSSANAALGGVTITTQDANNWVVGGLGFGDAVSGTETTPTAATGNLRVARGSTDAGTDNQAAGLVDNTAASASAVKCDMTVVNGGQPWAGAAVELRSVAGASAVTTSPLPPKSPRATGPTNPLWRALRTLLAYSADLANVAGTIFEDSVTDVGSASETATADAVFSAVATDSVASADSETATMDAVVSLADTLASADTETGTLTAPVAASDALTAADTATGALAVSGAASDALSAGESVTGTLAASVAVSETGSVAEAITDTLDAAVALADTLAASDSAVGGLALAAAASDVLTASDSATGIIALSGAVSESLAVASAETVTVDWAVAVADALTGAEASTATADVVASVSEALAATDSEDATVSPAGGTVYAVSVAEALAASDTEDATVQSSASSVTPPGFGGSGPPRRSRTRSLGASTHSGTHSGIHGTIAGRQTDEWRARMLRLLDDALEAPDEKGRPAKKKAKRVAPRELPPAPLTASRQPVEGLVDLFAAPPAPAPAPARPIPRAAKRTARAVVQAPAIAIIPPPVPVVRIGAAPVVAGVQFAAVRLGHVTARAGARPAVASVHSPARVAALVGAHAIENPSDEELLSLLTLP